MLVLQLWNKWADDSDTAIGTSLLPLQEVVNLTMVDEPDDAGNAGSSRTFLLQWQLDPDSGEAKALPPGSVPMLQVHLTYTARNSYSLDDVDTNEQQDDDQDVEHSASLITPEEGHENAKAAVGDVNEAGAIMNLHHTPANLGDGNDRSRTAGVGSDNNQDVVPSTNPLMSSAVAIQPVQAELCVEIIRACGLQVRHGPKQHPTTSTPVLACCYHLRSMILIRTSGTSHPVCLHGCCVLFYAVCHACSWMH